MTTDGGGYIAYLIVIMYYADFTVETILCHLIYLPGEDDAPAAAGVADMVANPVSIERSIARHDDRRWWLYSVLNSYNVLRQYHCRDNRQIIVTHMCR